MRICFWFVASVLAIGSAAAATDTVLRNPRLTVTLGHEAKGAIISLTDNATGVELAAAARTNRLFSLAFSKKAEPGGERLYMSSGDARQFSAHSERGVVTLSYDGFREWPVSVTCTARVLEKDEFVRWRLSAKFPDALVLEEVQFPCVTLRSPLGESVADDAAVFGHAKGGVIRRPGAMKTGWRVYGRQPGSLAAQFGCYYGERAGFYTAAYDAKGYPKDFEMCRTSEGVEVSWNPHCFATKSYAMDFDVVMGTFAGKPTDWRDAADLYKAWALKQPWCATTFDKRRDVPAWMRGGPAMVRFTRDWLAQPERIEQWLGDYWKKQFPSAPLITAYWGWEKVGSWVTPDYFPIFPSDAQFTNLVARSRALGCHAFPWPSGYHWTLMYRKQADGSFEWDDRKRFDEVARAHAVHARDGKLHVRTPSWLAGGDTACMCPGDPWTLNWWNHDVSAPLARRGCEMIQVDQVVGGGFPFCYSRAHAHPPGPGLWVTEVFTRQLRTMATVCRKIERDAVVCFEEPNERFNHLVGIQDYRDCETPHEWASVFAYLYHEFLPLFQSNPHGDVFETAYCAVNGQIPHTRPVMRRDGPLLANGGFEETKLAGWEHLRGYQGRAWNGQASRDEAQHHSGAASLRLDNIADSDIVQVSQNVTLPAMKRLRVSVWLKSGAAARRNGINVAAFVPATGFKGVARLQMPPPNSDWTRQSADFDVPAGATMLRLMIHAAAKATLWVDDVTLEEIRPDGTALELRPPPLPRHHEQMRRWVELFHGEARPFLQFGRMLRPPRLDAATTTNKNRAMPAVLHNAFRAPDGREAVVLANATDEPQSVTLHWKGERRLQLAPEAIVLVND